MVGPVRQRDNIADQKVAERVDRMERQRVTSAIKKQREALFAAQRTLAVRDARDDLITFTELTMPDMEKVHDDPLASRYQAQEFHRALAQALQDVEAGRLLRLLVTFPPRHGKSELCTRRFIPWCMGRDPYRNVAVGTYSNTFAEDWGQKVREVIRSPTYQQIFPNTEFQKAAQSVSKQITTEGGEMHFVGRGGGITGRGADIIIIDDPIKDREEADSPTVRDKTWSWFTDTFGSRLMSDMGAIIIIMTRWHEDDLVGRITDPKNPHYNAEYAALWKKIEIRGLAEDDDILGRPKDEALWPEKFSTKFLKALRQQNPGGFASLYQQRPAPAEGIFFKADQLHEYNDIGQLPKNLKIYAASDHALGTKEHNDRNACGLFGVDENDEIWVLPYLFWERAAPDTTVEAMIDLMRHHEIMTWFSAADHIGRSIGPFLRKRMREEKIYVPIHELTETQDKQRRAQAIRGRIAMGMVHFPRFASWWPDARHEMLTFPQGTHDDFVDMLSLLGRGLDWIGKASSPVASNDNEYPTGTFGWLKEDAKRLARFNKRQRLTNGW